MKNEDQQKIVENHNKISYIGDYNFMRSEGYCPADVDPMDYITSEKKHELKQIILPERTAEHEDLDYEGEFSISPLLDYPYGVDTSALKLALIDMANTIARLISSYPDHDTLQMNVARIFYRSISDAENFIGDYPDLNPFENDDEQ